jgi:hypothetical protein
MAKLQLQFVIPPDAKKTFADAEALLAKRRDLDRIDSPNKAAAAAAERTQTTLDEIEVALGAADVSGDEAQYNVLTVKRHAAADAAADAKDELARGERRRRGAAKLAAELDLEIGAMSGAIASAAVEIRRIVTTTWREKLTLALTGTIPGGLLAALREGWATAAAIGVPNRDLLEIKLHDPLRFAQGFGDRMLIDGRRNFMASADGRTAEDLSVSWRADPALKALHDALAPFQAIEREVRVVAVKARDRAEIARLAKPAATQQLREPPSGPTGAELAAMSEGEYRTHFSAAERRAHPGARYQPNMEIHRFPENGR